MPVGAFCASNKIMNQLSPDGPIYQAGTLSGNPVAMHAGLTSLTKLKNDATIYDRLEAKAKRLTDGFKEEASKHNIPLQTGYIGSMFGFFFCQDLPNNFEEVGKCDFTRFAKFHQMMLQRGFYFACSQYETGFISDAMSDEDIENTIKNAGEVFSQI
jgi:glutamate-1-semialdehyde 2,1-aminomutase